MKKKVKLFVTLAALCLSIAMLTFGVYAATSVTYTLSGRVTYTVQDVFVTVTSEVKPMTNAASQYADPTAVNGAVGSATWGTSISSTTAFKTYDASTLAPKSDNYSETNLDISLNTSALWMIKVTVKNDSAEDSAKVTVTNAALSGTTANLIWVAASTNGASPITVAASGTTTLTYYVALKSALTNVSDAGWEVALTLAKA